MVGIGFREKSEETPDDPRLAGRCDELSSLLKLRTIPFGMKMFERREDMEAIDRSAARNPFTPSTRSWASPLGWTVGITADDLVGAQCRAVVGLGNAKTEAWQSGAHMKGVWSTLEDATAHQGAMHCVPDGSTTRSRSGRCRAENWERPTSRCSTRRPGAMIYFINGLQWSGYKRFDWSVVGEFGLCRFMGQGADDAPTEPVDPVLCRTPLRRRARRRDADGDAAGISRQRHHRHEGAVEERLPLSVPAIRRAARRTRRHGRELSGEEVTR